MIKESKLKKSIILLVILFLLSLLTSRLVKAADFDYKNAPVPQVLGTSRSDLMRPAQNINPYKDSNEKLYAVMGKTQMIKFDEPVKRISITDPSFADLVLLSPKELLLNGKKAGRTSLVFWGDSDKPVFFNLVVQQDTDAFMQAVEQIAPEDDVKFSFTDDGVIMSGYISSTTVKNQINEIIKAYNYKVVDLTESPTKQVLLEVKITEASRNFMREFESKFSVGENYASFTKDVMKVPSLTTLSNILLNGQNTDYMYSSSTANIAWMLHAAEKKGVVRILAEPKLLAIDGKAGSFNVGSEIPYPASVGLSSTTSYAFKNTGVILNFTPTILEKSNRVILKLSPEVSEIDKSYTPSSGGVPGFKTRKVDTTVELADGETLIIAGLLAHTSSKSITQIPWLGDIPIIGALAKGQTWDKTDTEIVIFITPKIVEADKNKSGMEL